MNIYHFEVDRTETDYVKVEAKTEEEAQKKFQDGDYETISTKTWEKKSKLAKVEEIDEFEDVE